ncbi:hypothetical protein ACIQAD_23435 [Streptomyces sp. NPDC088551]|uniref:hypothetical protein n=1 Tax=Streptomyces sp. NPDC088551 TaxID=3365863 RepID=UPI00381236AD
MRSRLAARSTRLVLAAAAVTALAATTTACSADDGSNTGSAAASSSVASAGSGGSDNASTAKSGSNGSDSSGSTIKTASDDGGKSGYGQSCGTNDLDFTVTWESGVGGYYLVAAKAKPGITCYLDVNTPTVSFGSDADGVASPVGQGGEDPIQLTGSAVAYTGIDAKTTVTDGGTEFGNVIIALTEDDPNPAELELPDMATVDEPIVTNWSTNSAETIPVIV